MRATVIGANGFVGSAFVRHLRKKQIDVRAVTRETYAAMAGAESDVVIDASGNSTKYLADRDPAADFERSVLHRVRTLRDFPAALHVHVSSVDVYDDLRSPETTREDSPITAEGSSHYGFHKALAEDVVRHYAPRWLIVRLAGMVGPGLRKNPVFDILSGAPLRIHPDSRYQFAATDDVALAVWSLVEKNFANEIFNVCGSGLISPREIAAIAGRELNLSAVDPAAVPRVVDASIAKIQRVVPMPKTVDAIRSYVATAAHLAPAG